MAYIVIQCDDETARQIELADAYGDLCIFPDKYATSSDLWNPFQFGAVKNFDDLPEEYQP